jgi:acyl-CoA reductase-like NAD-dependent aldehyde dehydrogenase
MRAQGAGHERFRTVRFEDLTDPTDGSRHLGLLADDLGLPLRVSAAAEASINASGRAASSGWATWTTAQRQLLVERTADEAAHYGYVIDDD